MGVIYDPILGKLRSGKATTLILKDTEGIKWELTADTKGVLITTQANQVLTGLAGQPIGLLLSLTYSI